MDKFSSFILGVVTAMIVVGVPSVIIYWFIQIKSI